ncbi:hypothetical protein MTR67_043043 [Solanum verrucosum]|uniref:Uncharacterized protein n=1 Tax=Solanum verrucosum TaxID=315347 RepID=A0AAF0UN14_SOLVR|nr:hypothetical protein MTR67_043043 [Solanum verrucosum]
MRRKSARPWRPGKWKTEVEASDAVITCTILICDWMSIVCLNPGMTWLYPYYTGFNCNTKSVTLEIPGRERLEWDGVYMPKPAKIISFVWARKLMGQGCLDYLAHIQDVEVESPSIESIPVVSEFREVFPTNLPGMPPDRDINFCIDLETGTRPISIPPYRMTSVLDEV